MTAYPPPDFPVASVPTGLPKEAYATWLSRVGATLLDGLVGIGVAVPLLAPGLVMTFASSTAAHYDPNSESFTGGEASPAAVGLLIVGYVGVLAFGIWNAVIRQGRTGQTLGKKWVGIRVAKADSGQVPGILSCLLRALISGLITACTLYLNVLWPLWDAKRQTLHDKLLRTVVLAQ
jgi:uncharacterized RDD family membrane protein YckC